MTRLLMWYMRETVVGTFCARGMLFVFAVNQQETAMHIFKRQAHVLWRPHAEIRMSAKGNIQ